MGCLSGGSTFVVRVSAAVVLFTCGLGLSFAADEQSSEHESGWFYEMRALLEVECDESMEQSDELLSLVFVCLRSSCSYDEPSSFWGVSGTCLGDGTRDVVLMVSSAASGALLEGMVGESTVELLFNSPSLFELACCCTSSSSCADLGCYCPLSSSCVDSNSCSAFGCTRWGERGTETVSMQSL